MKNLKVWQKLAVMGAVFMVPFAVVTYTMTSSIDTLGSEFARQELRGLEYHGPLMKLLQDLQQHRGMASAWLSGGASFEERLARKRVDIENDIKKVDEVDQRLESALPVGKKWAAVSAACRDLLTQRTSQSPDQSFEQHTKVISDTVALISEVGDASKLTLDPDIDSYYLMNVLIFQGPELIESLAQARGIGSAHAVTGKGTAEQFERLNRLSTLVEYLQGKVDESLGKAVNANGALRPMIEASMATSAGVVRNAAGHVVKLAVSRKPDPNVEDYYSTMTRGLDSIFAMSAEVSEALRELLNRRVDKFQGEVRSTLAWAALGLLVVSLIGFFIMRDITVSLGEVVGTANRIATGDLTVLAASRSRRDEIGVLERAFERMVGALKETVGVAERIAAGDLAVAVKPRSERDVMGHALANMVERLSMLMGEVQRSGIQLNA